MDLDQENIAKIHKIFVEDNPKDKVKTIVIMDALDKNILMHIRKKGKLSERNVGNIILALCKALQFAHSHGIYSRDLRPENILMNENDSYD
jgi:serine/threonine protein kinase